METWANLPLWAKVVIVLFVVALLVTIFVSIAQLINLAAISTSIPISLIGVFTPGALTLTGSHRLFLPVQPKRGRGRPCGPGLTHNQIAGIMDATAVLHRAIRSSLEAEVRALVIQRILRRGPHAYPKSLPAFAMDQAIEDAVSHIELTILNRAVEIAIEELESLGYVKPG